MTKALIPNLIASADGHVINVISIAGSEVYDNGAGVHCALFAFASQELTKVFRLHKQQARSARSQRNDAAGISGQARSRDGRVAGGSRDRVQHRAFCRRCSRCKEGFFLSFSLNFAVD
jgi:hypothetical protein